MKTKYPVKTESEVVEQLADRRYRTRQERGFAHPQPVPTVMFTSINGLTMKAWRTKHAVHIRRHGTSVRATVTYNLQQTRGVETPKSSPYLKHTVAQLKDECRRLGLKVSGNKSDLLRRLKEASQ